MSDEDDEDQDEDEAMIEESFSVGGSEVYDQEVDSQHQMQQNIRNKGRGMSQDEDDEMVGIDSSGKQKLADIKKSLRQR